MGKHPIVGIIIQARMGSTRLPGKVLKNIGGKKLLEHIFQRLSFIKNNVTVVLATSLNSKDNIIEEFCLKNNIKCFRGSEENVLDRYYKCAKKYEFEHIVRLTADNPFVDIEELDNLITLHLTKPADYSTSLDALPYGVGTEIFSFKALEESHLKAVKEYHLEHVNEYILDNLNFFSVNVLSVEDFKNFPLIRLTVDTQDDYEKACFLVKNSKDEILTTKEAIKLCLQLSKKPKLMH